jgi:hypothetical protein
MGFSKLFCCIISMKEWIVPGALVSLSTGILATFLLWLRFF